MYETHEGKIVILIRNLLAKDFTRCEDAEWNRPALGSNKSQTLQVKQRILRPQEKQVIPRTARRLFSFQQIGTRDVDFFLYGIKRKYAH